MCYDEGYIDKFTGSNSAGFPVSYIAHAAHVCIQIPQPKHYSINDGLIVPDCAVLEKPDIIFLNHGLSFCCSKFRVQMIIESPMLNNLVTI